MSANHIVDREHGPLIVGLGGTMRASSATEMALRFSLEAASIAGARTVLLGAESLDLPMYKPGESDRVSPARQLLDSLAAADGVIIATPGYHGGISGLIKNALDYLEDSRFHDRPYLDSRAVGLIVCADGWQATTTTLVSLRSVVHALRGWPTPFAATINSTNPVFGESGCVLDQNVAKALELVAKQVVEFATSRQHLW